MTTQRGRVHLCAKRMVVAQAMAFAATIAIVRIAAAGIVGENLLSNPGFDDPLECPGRLYSNQGNGYGNLELVGQKSPGGDTIQKLTDWEIVVQEEAAQEDGTTLKSYGNSFYYTVPNSNVSKVSAASQESKSQRIVMYAPAPAGEANVVYVPKRLRQRVNVPEGGTYQISFWHGNGGQKNGSWADSELTIEVGGKIVFQRIFQHHVKAGESTPEWTKMWSDPFELAVGEYDFDIYSRQTTPYQSGVSSVDTIDDIQFGRFERQLEVSACNCSVADYSGPIAIADGASFALSVRADEGYNFTGWQGDGITDENRYDNPLSITVPGGGGDIHLIATAAAINANLIANGNFELVYGGLEGPVVMLNRVKSLYGLTYPYGTFSSWSCTGPGSGYGTVCWVLLGGNPVGSSTGGNNFELGLLVPDVNQQVGNGLEQTFYAPVDGIYTLTMNMRSLNYGIYTSGQRIPVYLDGKESAVIERELNTIITAETVILKKVHAGVHAIKLMAGTSLGDGPAATFVDAVVLSFKEKLPTGFLITIR